MGDAEAAAWSAVANFDAAAIYRSWVRSMLDNQDVNTEANPDLFGAVNSIVPPGACTIDPTFENMHD